MSVSIVFSLARDFPTYLLLNYVHILKPCLTHNLVATPVSNIKSSSVHQCSTFTTKCKELCLTHVDHAIVISCVFGFVFIIIDHHCSSCRSWLLLVFSYYDLAHRLHCHTLLCMNNCIIMNLAHHHHHFLFVAADYHKCFLIKNLRIDHIVMLFTV